MVIKKQSHPSDGSAFFLDQVLWIALHVLIDITF